MTRDETVALFLECEARRAEARDAALEVGKSENEAHEIARAAAKAHWNTWANVMLNKRKSLEESGERIAEGHSWKKEAEADFSGCFFLLKGLGGAKEAPVGNKRDAEAAVGLPVKSIVIDGTVLDMRGLVFPGDASFDNVTFEGDAWFDSAAFQAEASFHSAIFKGRTRFNSATFQGDAWFDSTIFKGRTWFESAVFKGRAAFPSTFEGDALFDGASFQHSSEFGSATFKRLSDFRNAKFEGAASFGKAKFEEGAWFASASFTGDARFDGATFSGVARFASATFSGDTWFDNATFIEATHFRGLTFPRDLRFRNAKFGPGRADFGLVTFQRVVQFDGAEFKGEAVFNAVGGKRTFSMAGARFERVPDFIQANFDEAPRLDNVHVEPSEGLELLTEEEARNWFARWRALKRLAIQACDTDRELEFNAQEIQAERKASGWPIPNKEQGWKTWLRSFSGWLYGFFSNYGRSLFRPFAAWFIGILIFAAFYLSQTGVMQRELTLKDAWWGSAAAQAGHYAVANTVPCYAREALKDTTSVGGLTEEVRNQTNARAEALHLAFRNAFVVLDGGSDASHRMYGCLYGLEMYAGQNPVPIVPSAVSTASAIQKLISGVLIFLFGLALRNMLKVK